MPEKTAREKLACIPAGCFKAYKLSLIAAYILYQVDNTFKAVKGYGIGD